MLSFVIRKMLNKKWMVLALLVGNILLISIAASNPMYTESVLKRTLDTQLSDYIEDNNKYPLTVKCVGSNYSQRVSMLTDFEAAIEASEEKMGLPIKEAVCYYEAVSKDTTTDLDRKDRREDICLASLTNLEDHITLVDGTMPSSEADADGVYDVVVSERCYQNLKLILGEVLTFNKVTVDGQALKIRIAGVFKETDAYDPYWVNNASSYYNDCFVTEELFRKWFIDDTNAGMSIRPAWYILYDYTDIQVEDVDQILSGGQYFVDYFASNSSVKVTNNFTSLLTDFEKDEAKVRTTFMVLQVPVLILLAAFIFMVSTQLLNMEQSEISVIKSRGASRMQIIGIYFIQSLVTIGISLLIGIPLAIFLVRMLGASSGFLEFVSRKSMQVRLSSTAISYALIAALFSMLTMVVPVFRHSRVTIVNQKQKKNSKHADKPMWQRLFLDIIILAVSIYGLYTFNNQKESLAQAVLAGESLDPLLFLSSSLFMLGAGLFLLRVLPYVVKFIFWLFKKKWDPAMYTSFIRVIRTRKQQGFIMAFLVMTIALGVFDASAARTISSNDERSLCYMTGADIVLEEKWHDNSLLLEDDPSLELEYTEPDYGRYEELVGRGADCVTKVFASNDGIVQLNGAASSLTSVQIMGINTQEFGQIAWFDSSLISPHWYNYLNAMSQNTDAVIVSSNFKDYGYSINDVIYYKTSDNAVIQGVIYGFVDYWPTYASASYRLSTDGTYKEEENFLIVGNLAKQQSVWGVVPYQIWLKNTDSSDYIYDFIAENEPEFSSFTDLAEEKVAHRNDAILQGTYGILTVGWIVSLVVCTVGFLIYWILSIRSRELQFGIFRAMGMSMREIFTMLLNEQFWISFVSILVGALVGWLTSRLFMPLIQIAYSSSENALPLEVVSKASDNIRLGVVVFVMAAGCIAFLAAMIRRMKVAQALKLGED